MSIEIQGPKKYKFQDNVCALIALQVVLDTDAVLEIEPSNGEDARLSFDHEGKRHFVEIQVKGSEAHIDMDSLAEWLMHFPNRSSVDSLLEKLISDSQRSVLFVATGRCKDTTLLHVSNLSFPRATTLAKSLPIETIKQMRAALEVYSKSNNPAHKKLERMRRSHISSKLLGITNNDLKSPLERVLVHEQLSENDVDLQCISALKLMHKVVPEQVETVLNRVKDIISSKKRTGINVLTEIKEVLAFARARIPLKDDTYVQRNEEEFLLKRLSRDRAILVTGHPRVGKSSCARSLLDTLRQQDYTVQICHDMGEAGRYLTEQVDELRAVLVDDPFGGAHALDNADREYKLLEQLLPRLINGRLLIVVQALDRLLEVTQSVSADDFFTSGLDWITIGNGDKDFLQTIWKDAVTCYSVPSEIAGKIELAIDSGSLDIEPGCLIHLASNHTKLGAFSNLEELEHFARQDAKALGASLRNEGMAPVLTALAVSTTQSLYVPEAELAFVLDYGRTDKPSFTKVNGTIVTYLGSPDLKISPPPSYDPLPFLTSESLDCLDRLELRRIIAEKKHSYTFSHPFYRASAESLLNASTRRLREEALSLVKRALFTACPFTALATAKNLSWIFQNLNSQDAKNGLMEIAAEGLSSVFPVVRDTCFQFLISRAGILSVGEQKQISDWVRKVQFPKLSFMEWMNNHPRIPVSEDDEFLEVDRFEKLISKEEVNSTLRLLNSMRPDFIANEDLVKAATYLRQHPDEINEQMASRLLSSEISLVRASAANIWLSEPRDNDSLILKQIFIEQHPAIIKAAYQGILISWSSCSDERRSILTKSMELMATSSVSAVVLIGQLIHIDREEYGGEITPWQLFEVLMPNVLENLPTGVFFRDDGLYTVMDSALGNISLKSLLKIIDLWIERIVEITAKDVPSDYLLGVTTMIIKGISLECEGRDARFSRILQLSGTACRIRVISDLIDYWELLSQSERTLILTHLSESSKDEVWLRAAAITRSDVPIDIQALILNHETNLNAPSKEDINGLAPELLNASIHIYTGIHPVIYYLGVHRSGNSAWKEVIYEIAHTPSHEMFDICWEWLLRSSSNETVLSKIIVELGSEHFERISELLLEQKKRTTGDFMPKVWESLLNLSVTKEQKSICLERMASISPDAIDSIWEIDEWIPESYQNEFMMHFKPDVMLIMLLQQLETFAEANNSDSKRLIPDLLYGFIEKQPPKHWGTYDVIKHMVVQLGLESQKLNVLIEENRSAKIDELRRWPNKKQPILHRWVE